MSAGHDCDLLVAGSGAAGLAAAVTAARAGLRVIMVEKAPQFGGTTVSSAGVIWIPNSSAARSAGIADSPAAALTYLHAQGGNRLDADKAEVYVETAADVLDWFESNSHLRCALAAAWPDYHPTVAGGSAGGRSLGPVAFDGRTLGKRFADLRPPIATTTIMGGMIVGREDLAHFYGMQRSWRSALTVAGRFARYARDRLTHRRGTRLSNGSALTAMLARTAFELGVELRLSAPIKELLFDGDRVVGAAVDGAPGRQELRARCGVILATGGYPANPALRARVGDGIGTGSTHRSLAPAENVGDGYALGSALGGTMVEALAHPAAWTPVSLVPQRDGSAMPFPHFFDRGKAGYIAVTRSGRRFISEARSYHDFVPALVEACQSEPKVACHLIADADAIRRYGLGAAPPWPGRLGPHVRSGYIVKADTLAALANKCGIDPAGLAATVARFNERAAEGIDIEFGKGTDVYERFNGSAGVAPNPCVQPIGKAPFYAIRLVPGDIGTFAGLRTDRDARVLDAAGGPIEGLYAVGNDAASFMGGSYPGAGITLGPALVFGHRAARHAAATV
jgi:succinate dehydrogenase/fumarate reductase flavoprotein subunit